MDSIAVHEIVNVIGGQHLSLCQILSLPARTGEMCHFSKLGDLSMHSSETFDIAHVTD